MIKSETYRRGIVLSTIFNVFSKGLVFFNIILIAYYFGTSLEVDVYFYAYNLILLLVTYLSGLNSSVIIPESIRLRNTSSIAVSMRFLNSILVFHVLFILLISIVILVSPVMSFKLVSRYSESVLEQNLWTLYLAVPLLLFMAVAAYFTDILVSYRFFTVPMLVQCINSILSIATLVFFHRQFGILSAALGLLGSYLLNILILVSLMRKHLDWKFRIYFQMPEKRVFRNVVNAQVASFATSIGNYAPIYFFSGWQTGLVSALIYAQQIFYQPTALFTNQVAVVSRIKLNELFIAKDTVAIKRNFQSSLGVSLFILTALASFMFLFSNELILTLFARGSFTAESSANASMFLRYLSLALPLIAIDIMVSNLLYVSQKLRIVLFYQVISNCLSVVLTYLGIKALGPIGFPIAYFVSCVLRVVFLGIICKRYFTYINFLSTVTYSVKILVLNVIISVVIWIALAWIDTENHYLRLAIGGLIFIVVLGITTKTTRLSPYFSDMIESFTDKLAIALSKVRRKN